MRRIPRVFGASVALACLLVGSGRAAPGLLVGMDDDTLEWADKLQVRSTLGYARELGIRAVRVTVHWHPGETRLGIDDRIPRLLLSRQQPSVALRRPSHSPVEFYRKLGEAYGASRCTAPIFDTIGHNPYPTTNAERPWTRYPGGTIAGGATTPG